MVVGRARELALLRSTLGRVAGHTGGGAVALLLGEAGVGKSHLLAALEDEARGRGYEVRVGRCFADGGQRAFGPWREALAGTSALEGRADGAPLGARDDRERSFEAVLAALEERSRARPLLVAIEDFHWADRDSLLLFLHVARFGLGAPLLLVGSIRTPIATARPAPCSMSCSASWPASPAASA